ncbi:hypothetical protein BEP19_05450 [Ammoniphilus oxalaticus]|uniref:Aminoglycoside phosphotransferase domain-containing protein n=1 Tax=Ammoniphilus oxalaticus TaxID=66863 RepID=A0A419SIK7_9BACL|nr:hypothetical protein [Ammoniphilus oxalaticus]RKD23874.1 hypothetical protein BEP19_05450 [Ammoniphilus oxalaticus]
MKVTLNQLKRLLASYRLKVIQAHAAENGYVVDTNRGKRLVSIWDNAQLLRWSNMWREELTRQDGRRAQRFLVNQNKKKYVHYRGHYFALSVFPQGRQIDLQREDECKLAGELFAHFHSALDRIDQKVTTECHAKLNEDYFTNGSTLIKNVMEIIEQKSEPTLIDELIYANLPLLYQRFRRARQLWEGTQEHTSYFPLSFCWFNLEQIKWDQRGWMIHGGINRPLSAMHQDSAFLIREIYEKSDWNLQSVIAFLDGYMRKRNLTEHELIYILTQFAIPWDVWVHFDEYLKNDGLCEIKGEKLLEDLQKQNHWDELTTFFGRFIDQQKSASA